VFRRFHDQRTSKETTVITLLLVVLLLTLVTWPGMLDKFDAISRRRRSGIAFPLSRPVRRFIQDHNRRFPRLPGKRP
jgi:hypothetical protein